MTNAVNIAQGGSNNVTFRNRIINGAMVIDQRFAGAATTPTTDQYTIDRWQAAIGSASSWITFQQNSGNAPTTQGFSQCLKLLSTGANTPASGTIYALQQKIEGNNIYDFALGTASAKTFTFSCWIYVSVAGTYGVVFTNNNITRAYGATYTLTANTWTFVTATIPGDTTGTWETGTSTGMRVIFSPGTGSSNSISAGSWQTTSGNAYNVTGTTQLSATNGATMYITGVQLEAGTTASPFEYRQYGTELQLCQRYFETLTTIYVPTLYKTGANGTVRTSVWFYKVTKRATPTVTTSNISYDNCSGLTIDRNSSDYYSTYATANGGTNFGYNYDFTSSAEL